MFPEEQAEVETFAAYLLLRRKLREKQLLTDDISTEELTRLVEGGGSFNWLDAEAENVYSRKDGEAVRWPKKT
jgi:hypothetical protein